LKPKAKRQKVKEKLLMLSCTFQHPRVLEKKYEYNLRLIGIAITIVIVILILILLVIVILTVPLLV